MVGMGMVLIHLCAFWYCATVLPVIFADDPSAMKLHLAIALFLYTNVIFSYGSAILSDPGFVPQQQDVDAELKKDLKTASWHLGTGLEWKWCRHCDSPKPPRSHHCRMCGR